MSTSWIEAVEFELHQRRLRRREVTRLVAELTDHLSDLADSCGDVLSPTSARHAPPSHPLSPKEKPMSMDAALADRLGNPVDIADTALREFRRRRHRGFGADLVAFVTFVLLPLPIWLVASVGTGWLGARSLEWIGLIPTTDIMPLDVTLVQIVATQLAVITAAVLPSAGFVALFAHLARRTRRPLLWGVSTCLLVVVATAIFCFVVDLDRPHGTRYWAGPVSNSNLAQRRLLQASVPLLIGLDVLRRSTRRPFETVAG